MPYCNIPRDLSRVKSKLAFNMTKRQLICFGTAAAIGVPTYIFSRGTLGNEGAVILMIGVMIPFFMLAMYEKDGQPAEKVLRNYIRARFLWPRKRIYKTENFYEIIGKEGNAFASNNKTTTKTSGCQRQTGKRK